MGRKVLVNIIALFAGLLIQSAGAETLPVSGKYVPNEIIVKFRSKVEDGTSQALKNLNTQYKVREIKPLFKDFEKKQQDIASLKKKNTALLSDKEKHTLRRLQRVSKNIKAPNLERIYKLKLELVKNQTLTEAIAAYAASPDVEYAELNHVISVTLNPNDPYYPILWPLNNTGQIYPASGAFNLPPGTPDSDIDAPEAWDIHTGSSNIIVAVIDTGADYNHRDLRSNMWVNEAERNGSAGTDDDGNGYIDDIYGYDFINIDGDPLDDHGHGTHCSGTIAAKGNNGLDITGVCWDSRIIALKILDDSGGGTVGEAIEAFYYAVANGADITSNSWGMTSYSQALDEAVQYAYSQGVMIIASAGNNNSAAPFYPAYYDNVISVAATNSKDAKAPFSNYGPWVDIAAPGVDILSLRAGGTSMGKTYDDYTTIASGTSMSGPHIAGACAFLLSANPLMTINEAYDILMNTVDPIADGICISDGRLNLYNAILAVTSLKSRISFDSNSYSCSDAVSILLVDNGLKGIGQQAITVTSSNGDHETILLSEIVSVGVFKGTILTESSNVITEDGKLQVSNEEVISAIYEDANDGTGTPATVTDTAFTDCQAPKIFNVTTGFPGREPRIRFETDEPATARVQCGLACGGTYIIEVSDSKPATAHILILTNIQPETEYFYIIEAADAVGNKTINDNKGRCFSFTTTSPPGEIYVPAQCPTIQDAIDNSWEGGKIIVADGVYTGTGNRDIDFRGRPVTLKSKNGPKNCIIDCQGSESDSHRGFDFHSGESSTSVLSGFTITNGYIEGSWYVGMGGAILCSNNSNPLITDCIFRANRAGWDGGAIFNYESSPTINKCTFTGNSAVGNDGGAINNESSSPIISSCAFIGNTSRDWGGAIRNLGNCDITLKNCIFTGNLSDDGGALFFYHNNYPTIIGCTFAGNSAPNGNALACDSANSPNYIQISSSIFADSNSAILNLDNSLITIEYSNVEGSWPGQGNISDDPCFVNPGYWDANNWHDGNYRLLKNSPCIDAGDPNYTPGPDETDAGGSLRLVDGDKNGDAVIDMGAYEYRTALPAKVHILPRIINLASRGNWITCLILLPEDYKACDVKAGSILLNYNIMADKIRGSGQIVIVQFSRSEVQKILKVGKNEITITGSLKDGNTFEGKSFIWAIKAGKK